MKTIKTWLTVKFEEKDAYVEACLNYETGVFYLTHDSNDCNVIFKSGGYAKESVETSINRAKCVMAALKFIKQEIG